MSGKARTMEAEQPPPHSRWNTFLGRCGAFCEAHLKQTMFNRRPCAAPLCALYPEARFENKRHTYSGTLSGHAIHMHVPGTLTPGTYSGHAH